MFGTRFGVVSRDGQQTAPGFAHCVLFGSAPTRDFSRQHAEVPFNRGDLRKAGQAQHPLQHEDQLDRYEPTRPWLNKATQEAREYLRRNLPDGPARDEIEALRARDRYQNIPSEQRENFFHDFVNWVQGNGKAGDYRRAGLPTDTPQRKLLSFDPGVRAFIDDKVARAAEFEAEIAKMKMRGPGVGPGGRPATLEDLFRYFKYVVRQAPMDPSDLWWMDKQPPPDDRSGTAPYASVTAPGNAVLPGTSRGPGARPDDSSSFRAGIETTQVNPDDFYSRAAANPAVPAPVEDRAEREAARAAEEARRNAAIEARLAAETERHNRLMAETKAQYDAALAAIEAKQAAAAKAATDDAAAAEQRGMERMKTAAIAHYEGEYAKKKAEHEAELARTRAGLEQQFATAHAAKDADYTARIEQLVASHNAEIELHRGEQAKLHERAEHAYQLALLTEGAANERVQHLADKYAELERGYQQQLVAVQAAAQDLQVARIADRAHAERVYAETLEKLQRSEQQLVVATTAIEEASKEVVVYEEPARAPRTELPTEPVPPPPAAAGEAYSNVADAPGPSRSDTPLDERQKDNIELLLKASSAPGYSLLGRGSARSENDVLLKVREGKTAPEHASALRDIFANSTTRELGYIFKTMGMPPMLVSDVEAIRGKALAELAAAPPPPAATPSKTNKRGREEVSAPTTSEKAAAEAAAARTAAEADLASQEPQEWLDIVLNDEKASKKGSGVDANQLKLASQLLNATGLGAWLQQLLTPGAPDPPPPKGRELRVLKLLMGQQGAFVRVPVSRKLAGTVNTYLKKHESLRKQIHEEEVRSSGLGK